MSDTLMGENEAYSRLRGELHQKNPGKIEYPSATNNRGHMGGGHEPSDKAHDTRQGVRREHHAMGDRIGGMMKKAAAREEHGWGDAIGGAFKKAGSAMGKGVGAAAKTVGNGMQKAGKGVANFKRGGNCK